MNKDNSSLPSLEVKEDGQIWLIPNCPVEPKKWEQGDSLSYNEAAWQFYKESLASAPRYLVSNQEVAREIICYELYGGPQVDIPWKITVKNHSGKLFDFPRYKYDVEILEQPCEDSGTDEMGRKVDFEKVAVISTHEQKFELLRDQEQYDMWWSILGIMDDMSAKPEPLIPELMKRYSITRKESVENK